MKCPDAECGYENSLSNENCSCCGAFLGFPNVNECKQKGELDALRKRYRAEVRLARKDGYEDKRKEFEKAAKKSAAVINVNLEYLHTFIVGSNALYSTYQLQAEGEVRDLAKTEFDKERRGIESTLFGSYGKNIRYAALSLDGTGLKSYGDYTIVLADKAVKKRATLLEENSYRFIKRHQVLAGGEIPRGYRSLWKDRVKLLVAKVAKKIPLTKKDKYNTIVLDSTGNRETDEFVEVHIYGKINSAAVQAVRGSSKTAFGNDLLARVKDYLKLNKKDWIEE